MSTFGNYANYDRDISYYTMPNSYFSSGSAHDIDYSGNRNFRSHYARAVSVNWMSAESFAPQ